MDPQLIQIAAVYALPVLFAITVHEAAHGYVARYFGDPTAAQAGRITLNPFKHIDPIGTILMPIALYLAIGLPFGYAKPVPVDADRLRHPRRDMIFVALAGPTSNLIQAILWALMFVLLMSVGFHERFFLEVANAGIKINLLICAFNLLPLPPLDGGRILMELLPDRLAQVVSRMDHWLLFIVTGLIVADIVGKTYIVSKYWLQPLEALGLRLVNLVVEPLVLLLR